MAGLLELTVGPSVRDLVGNKQDTTRLGLVTIVLSVAALVAAVALSRARGGIPTRRVAVALGPLIPALACFTRVGALWFLPGALLLAGGALVLSGTRQHEFAAAFDEPLARRTVIIGASVIRHAGSTPSGSHA